MSKDRAMRDVLLNLVDTIDATGGVVEDDHGYIVPVADEKWSDLGAVYVDACQVLGRKMMQVLGRKIKQVKEDAHEGCRRNDGTGSRVL